MSPLHMIHVLKQNVHFTNVPHNILEFLFISRQNLLKYNTGKWQDHAVASYIYKS